MPPVAAAEFEAETDSALQLLDDQDDRALATADDGVEVDWDRGKVSLVRYQSWRESRRATLLALQRRKAVVALVGPPGVGKTVMLDKLEEFLVSRKKQVVIQRGDIDLDLVPQDATLLIDNADDLPTEHFEQLGSRPDLGFVLAGDERLAPVVRMLTKREMPLAGRLRIISLEPVVGNDLAAYVEARLPKRRKWRWEFTSEVVTRIAELSGGVPAKLNQLIDGAAAWAVAGRQKLITLDMVEKTAAGETAPVEEEEDLTSKRARSKQERRGIRRARKETEPRRKSVMPGSTAPAWSFFVWLKSFRQ